MTTTVSKDGKITIPAEFRTKDGIGPGQLKIQRTGPGRYELSKAADSEEETLVDWILACPHKGWFVEPDRSEMTNLEPSKLFEE